MTMLAILRWPKEAVLSFNASWFWRGQDVRASAALASRARLPLEIIRRPTLYQRSGRALFSRKSFPWLALLVVGTGLQWPVIWVQADGPPANWSPPIEPPGTVVVTHHSAEHLAARYKFQPTMAAAIDLFKDAASADQTNRVALNAPAVIPLKNEMPVVHASTAAITSTEATTAPASTAELSLRQAVQQWSQAWGQKNVHAYLSMYAVTFEPPKGLSRETWEQQRTQRIQSKRRIQHEVRGLQLSLSPSQATVQFEQLYADERLQQTDQKTLHWVMQDGQWRITRETTR
jgi:ketosteroid isomerase-like protein